MHIGWLGVMLFVGGVVGLVVAYRRHGARWVVLSTVALSLVGVSAFAVSVVTRLPGTIQYQGEFYGDEDFGAGADPRAYPCESLDQLRSGGDPVYAPLVGELAPLGRVHGWAGPLMFLGHERNYPPPEIFVEIHQDCYLRYVSWI
jgi:hypothetical protein